MNAIDTYKPSELTVAELAALDIDLTKLSARRRFIIGAGGLVVGAALGACGADNNATAPTATPEAGYPRTIEHIGGSTTLARKPTRVLAMRSFYELDAMLALGIAPAIIGSFPGRNLRPWQIAAGAEEAEIMDMTNGPNLEQATAAGIDLAIANQPVVTTLQEQVDAMRAVAPVVGLPAFDFAEQLRIVAACLDVDEEILTMQVEELQDTLDGFQVEQPPARIVGFRIFDDSTITLITPQSEASRLLDRIGLSSLSAPPVPADQARKDFVSVSLEVAPDVLDADVLLGFDDERLSEQMDAFEATPLFQQLPVVQSGNYHRLNPDNTAAMLAPSVLSLPVALKVLQQILDV